MDTRMRLDALLRSRIAVLDGAWGVLLQDAQNVQAIALYPWLFTPVIFVIVSVMAFSFVGDGMRDAADPYSR